MIRFGPAGIPLSCKGRTLRDGISDVHHLGLTAMEVQFFKVNPLTRVVLDDEVGKVARSLPLQLVVEAGATERLRAPVRAQLEAPLRKRDSVTTLTWSMAKDEEDLAQTRALAKALDVDLTLHAPYYVDFFGSGEARSRSIRQIQWAGVLAQRLGARLAVTHLGFYGPGEHSESVKELTRIAAELSQWIREFTDGEVRLAVEPSGHPDVFGSKAEVLELARTVKGIVPVFNIPHLAAREKFPLDQPEAIKPVLEEFVRASGGNLYGNFSGVELYGQGDFRLTPIKRGQMKFDPLADLLADRDYDVTVISSSPLLEHDAMYMKLLYDRALTRRWTRQHAPAPPKATSPPKAVPPPKAAPKGLSNRPARRPPPKPRAPRAGDRRPSGRPPPSRSGGGRDRRRHR